MRQILKQISNEEDFLFNGYVVIKDVIPQKLIFELEKLVAEVNITDREEFFLAILLSDLQVRTNIHQRLGEIVAPWTKEILIEMKYVLGTFAIKPNGQSSSFSVHQDWSLVDESEFSSLSVWIPLIDTSIKNGCFRILPKSSKYFSYPRGMNIPFPYQSYIPQLAESYMLPLEMKAGDVLVFDHRLVHDSGPNISGLTRTAAVLAFIPEETSPCHYYRAKEAETIDFYQLPENFLVTNNFFDYSQPPQNSTLLRSYPYTEPAIDFEKFKQLYATSVS